MVLYPKSEPIDTIRLPTCCEAGARKGRLVIRALLSLRLKAI
jgi:hypothetical protein